MGYLVGELLPAACECFTSVWMTKEAHDDHGAVMCRPKGIDRKNDRNGRTPYEQTEHRKENEQMAETLKVQPLFSSPSYSARSFQPIVCSKTCSIPIFQIQL